MVYTLLCMLCILGSLHSSRSSIHRPTAFQAVCFPEQSKNGGMHYNKQKIVTLLNTILQLFNLIVHIYFQNRLRGSGHGIAASRMDAKLNTAGWISEQMGGVRLVCVKIPTKLFSRSRRYKGLERTLG